MFKIRCFCAVDISYDVKKALEDFQSEIRHQFEKVSWTKPGGLHITMKFLGDQKESFVDKISDALSESVRDFSKVRMEFGGLGFFPNPRRPRVIWVGLKLGESELINLNKKIEDALARLNIPRESKRFQPHLTLGRIRKSVPDEKKYEDIIMKNQDRNFGFTIADKLFLMRSILKPQGAEYIPLGTYEFN